MREVSIGTYFEDMRLFASKNNAKSNCVGAYTSEIGPNGTYHKEIVWENGAMWCEKIELVTEVISVDVHGYRLNREVKFNKIEYWTSSDSASKIVYELICDKK